MAALYPMVCTGSCLTHTSYFDQFMSFSSSKCHVFVECLSRFMRFLYILLFLGMRPTCVRRVICIITRRKYSIWGRADNCDISWNTGRQSLLSPSPFRVGEEICNLINQHSLQSLSGTHLSDVILTLFSLFRHHFKIGHERFVIPMHLAFRVSKVSIKKRWVSTSTTYSHLSWGDNREEKETGSLTIQIYVSLRFSQLCL